MSEVIFELILRDMTLSVWKHFLVSPSLHKKIRCTICKKKEREENSLSMCFLKHLNHLSAYLKYSDASISQASIVQITVKIQRLQMPLL